jgi:hypothetical protein
MHSTRGAINMGNNHEIVSNLEPGFQIHEVCIPFINCLINPFNNHIQKFLYGGGLERKGHPREFKNLAML